MKCQGLGLLAFARGTSGFLSQRASNAASNFMSRPLHFGATCMAAALHTVNTMGKFQNEWKHMGSLFWGFGRKFSVVQRHPSVFKAGFSPHASDNCVYNWTRSVVSNKLSSPKRQWAHTQRLETLIKRFVDVPTKLSCLLIVNPGNVGSTYNQLLTTNTEGVDVLMQVIIRCSFHVTSVMPSQWCLLGVYWAFHSKW